jgi:probable rRNA maturation factor
MSVSGDSSPVPLPAETTSEAEPPERLTICLVSEDGDWSGFGAVEDAVRGAAGALARHPRLTLPPACEASVVLASDEVVRRLNLAHRGKDAATNVLSFPFQPPPGAEPGDAAYLGDVVLAAETVRREAADLGIEPHHHLQHLVVHGLLHLLGWDHQTEAEAEAMEHLEAQILETIGVANPYAASAET